MLKSYDELRKVDVSKYTEKRDGAEYLNWAKCVDLLHENGATIVDFNPVLNEKTGTSLFMTDKEFTDKNGIINRCYETEIEITVDSDKWRVRGPVMNGGNPVKDNSMSQQRVWNSQCRLFVKGIAKRTGLGFDLWLKGEQEEEKDNWEDDLSKHKLGAIQQRLEQLVTRKTKEGLSVTKIAENLGITEEEFRNYFTYFAVLDRLEKRVGEMKVDK